MQQLSLPRWAKRARRGTICLSGFLLAGSSYGPAAGAEDAAKFSIAVHVERGLLSVDARNAPLGVVLEAIANQAGFRLKTKGGLDTPVTWSFSGVPPDKGVRRLLRNVSSVMVYAPSEDGGTGRLISIRTLRRKADPADDSMSVARTIPTPPPHQTASVAESQPQPGAILARVKWDGDRENRLQAVRQLIRKPNATSAEVLAVLLSQDEDSVIRRIAAIGLGKLRVPEAKEALIAALSDEDSLVRRRALQGLAKTWRNQAVEPLSTVLIEDPEPNVRRQAALRLGRIYSEEAYRSLDAARFDTDISVRRAVMAGLARLQDM